VAVREFAEARRLYEHAIAAVGAAGARMKAAALNEECALEAVRALYGAPEVVDAEIVEDDPAIYCDPHEMPEADETGVVMTPLGPIYPEVEGTPFRDAGCPGPTLGCSTCGAEASQTCQMLF
jgi:hypothetical protein